MARKDALLRLHKRLVDQRDDLRHKLEMGAALSSDYGAGTSDPGDVASDDAEREVNTQLASLETRELMKIERAIRAIREGRYGQCDVCGKRGFPPGVGAMGNWDGDRVWHSTCDPNSAVSRK